MDIPNEFTHRQFLGNSMRNWKIHLYVMGECTINILMTNIINTKIRNIINIKYIAILEYVEYGNVNKSSHKWEDYWKFHDLLQDDHTLYIYTPHFSDNAMKANLYPMFFFPPKAARCSCSWRWGWWTATVPSRGDFATKRSRLRQKDV